MFGLPDNGPGSVAFVHDKVKEHLEPFNQPTPEGLFPEVQPEPLNEVKTEVAVPDEPAKVEEAPTAATSKESEDK